ncbi:MAG: mechanosensitive ion channel family protein [Proteobacteria bacterium]|nr:mechanosensitive ion channel family protein [Pseudomonadota bacterium]
MIRLIFPILLLTLFGALFNFWWEVLALVGLGPEVHWTKSLHNFVALVIWAFVAVGINRFLQVFLWEGYYLRQAGSTVPKLLGDLIGLFVWIAAIFCALTFVYGFEISGLVTTSGFALRNMIADVFTGIALGIERPMREGDWIELVDDHLIGQVTEINWRATRLVTKENIAIIVPNSFLATHPFLNYHKPEKHFRDKFEIMLGYDVTAHQAERIMMAAIREIPEIMAVPRNSAVRIKTFTERGISWEVRYWTPDFSSRSRLRYTVQRNILRNMHYAGVKVPRHSVEFTELDDRPDPDAALRDEVTVLGNIELFHSLELNELTQLRQNMLRRLCVAGNPVVTQGDAEGASLFVVKEGFLDVFIKGEDGNDVQVGRLSPGMFFGEMSLLTGAPRSATVTPSVDAILFEIRHQSIEPLLKARPDLVRQFSEAVADRQMRNNQSLSAASDAEFQEEREALAGRILSGIVGFFGLGNGGPKPPAGDA